MRIYFVQNAPIPILAQSGRQAGKHYYLYIYFANKSAVKNENVSSEFIDDSNPIASF
jgi:hypothetical protein